MEDTITLPYINEVDLSKTGKYNFSPAPFYEVVYRDIDDSIKVKKVSNIRENAVMFAEYMKKLVDIYKEATNDK